MEVILQSDVIERHMKALMLSSAYIAHQSWHILVRVAASDGGQLGTAELDRQGWSD